MLIGCAYHPERWPESAWASDARLMQELGLGPVCIGRFAWCRLEPRRDRFHFEWLLRCLDVLGEAGLKVILASPSAAPPPWLFERHASILPADENLARHWLGGTGHVCISNAPYRKYVRRLLGEMAAACRDQPGVAGWRLDPGPAAAGGPVCFCDDCVHAFRGWLKKRYGTIGRLNELWGTAFWAQDYTDWHEVPAPRRTPGGPPPAMSLDWRRFVSDTALDFVREQRDLVRRYSPRIPVSAVCAGPATAGADLFALAAELDAVTLHDAPDAALPLDVGRPRRIAGIAPGVRHTGGALGAAPPPGHVRRHLLRHWALGAEAAEFGRWRTSPVGQEIYAEGVVDLDPALKDRFDGVADAASVLARLRDRLPGVRLDAPVAIVVDFDWLWAAEWPGLLPAGTFAGLVGRLLDAFAARGVGTRLVSAEADLTGFAALALPLPMIVPAALAERLSARIHAGAALLAGPLAGSRTDSGNRTPQLAPGPLRELVGLEVTHLSGTGGGPVRVADASGGDTLGAGLDLCEQLRCEGAETLAVFTAGPLAGRPALCRQPAGSGSVLYLGTIPDEDLARAAADRLCEAAGLDEVPPPACAVEALRVVGADGATALVLLNGGSEPVEVPVPEGAARDLVSDSDVAGTVRLEPFGAAVLL
jgi:beta-galactosidase